MSPYYNELDPSEMANAVDEFASALDADANEEVIHSFLANHAYLLFLMPGHSHYLAVAKPALGSDLVADFALYGSGNGPWWTFVELERPSDRLFNQRGDPSSRLVHAMRQVQDWRRWIEDNPGYFESIFGNDMGVRRSLVLTRVIIGRRHELNESDRERLLQMNRHNHSDWIMTYDSLLEPASRAVDLMRGPIIHKVALPFGEFARIRRSEGFRGLLRR